MGVLSDDQFSDRVNNSSGVSRMLHSGAEVEVGPHNAGVHGVSLQGHEEKYASPVVRQQVTAHAQKMLADPTLRSDPDVMQGGWNEQRSGLRYLDASRQVRGRTQAVAEGRTNNQVAVFDFGTGDTVYTARPTTGKYERRSGNPAEGWTTRRKPVLGSREPTRRAR